jgi:hypothetical protein
MGPLPTRRLIEAAAALEPADRALLNLWVHRGLDDERVAGLTGMSVVAVQARRERILAGLSERLGEPSEDVLIALQALEAGADAPDRTAAAAGAEGRPDVTATAGGLDTPATVSTTGLPEPPAVQPESKGDPQVEPRGDPQVEPRGDPQVEPSGDPQVEPEALEEKPEAEREGRRRRGWLWAALTAGIAAVVAVLLVVLLTGGSSHNASDLVPSASATVAGSATAPPARATTPATPTASDPAPSSTTAAGSGTASTPARRTTSGRHALAGLPGGLRHVSGVVRLVGKIDHLKLKLTVKGLPLVRHGYYAAWLFNSVLDSRRLGRVTRDRPNTYRLPRGARRFHFIDISFQPKGTVNHSGESKLRAINPVDGPKTIIHMARARKPRRLSRARAVRHHTAKTRHHAKTQTARRSARHRRATRHGHHRSHRRPTRRPHGTQRSHRTHRPHGAHRRHGAQRRRGSRSSRASTS